jgi:hypothetical protein
MSKPAGPPLQHHDTARTHRRTSSRTTSISSSVVTVKRAADLHDADPNASLGQPHTTSTPSTTAPSTAATSPPSANINRWSHSTASSLSSQPREKGHTQQPASARHARPRSPDYDHHPPMTKPPQMPSLPPILLPSTVYQPNTPTSASTADSPSTSGLFTPSVFNSAQPRDYFNSRPLGPQPTSQRPPSRSKVERVLGKSPLGSPAIIQERDARHDTASGPARPSTGLRSAAPAPRETAQKQPQSAGHRQAPSRDTSRAPSRDQHRSGAHDRRESTSRDHHRSGSNASAILEDNYQGTPPRSREKREKDKKAMLSRALQKANTAVLLDNAQNFEGAMEAYEDACKLLQQVMIRSSAEEDRRKLDAIVSQMGVAATNGYCRTLHID